MNFSVSKLLFLVNYKLIAATVSEPGANKRGSSLIGKKLRYRGIQSLFLARTTIPCKSTALPKSSIRT